MASGSSRATQRDQIFSMINFMGMPNLFSILNPTFVHHPLLRVLSQQNINLDLFYDKNMLIKNEWCKYAIINPKAQAIFVHAIVNVIFKYILQVKNKKDLSNNNFGVLNHIKTHYGCYEITKNGGSHIHTLLWLNDSLDPNKLVQTLLDDEIF
jgi:hypothetical protein